ncbi:HGxxPAAW family protein [Georgenia sp. AZ-5]|uniref:HGxxPAAW family protein n=1 Tax=Georgenia sp. AZ-5 TaxID=3367526 RepID=UPI003754F4DB
MPQLPEQQTYTLPPAAPHTNHGRTPAAWLLMLGVCLGFAVTGIGLILSYDWLALTGVGVVVLAVVVSLVLRGMGLGQPAPTPVQREEKDWYSA